MRKNCMLYIDVTELLKNYAIVKENFVKLFLYKKYWKLINEEKNLRSFPICLFYCLLCLILWYCNDPKFSDR